jgi:hypothetical protein
MERSFSPTIWISTSRIDPLQYLVVAASDSLYTFAMLAA